MNVLFLLAHAGEGGGSALFQLPPLHPILVNFTAALVPLSLFSDVLGRLLRKPSLTSAGWWMLLYAAAVTPFTALAGWLWLRQMGGMDIPAMAIHKWLGTALAVVFSVLVFWRWRIHRRDGAAPGALYMICAAVVVAALTFQGHLGGSMSFASDDMDAGGHMTSLSPPGHSSSTTLPHGSGTEPGRALQWRDHIDLKE